ncbi:2OG-Fe(II) oxygenase [Bdellovibrio sp. SKB1291214]|uniref:2OG-Fe(II) oxygenase n=1 Tax=Bdellovibrio sp. SKB1291214 TaxID=1732569 RepID=UPI000B51C57D|nr:2OG-Fe(II) oxygenase [Bdellovibrio sp. SKB1291214]UYL09009.1 2OG-Fe(II) oxygenase [Bdellovibrio sp. SKB1291214]
MQHLTPWPHFIFDDFLPDESLKRLQAILPEHQNGFRQDDDDDMEIRYKFLPDLPLAKYFLGPEFKAFLQTTTGLSLRINEKSLVQLRVMTPDSPPMPAHVDNQEQKSLVCLLYVSPDWKEEYGGELCLLENKSALEQSSSSKLIAPLSNRMVLFCSEDSYWHSVKQVNHWLRYSIIMEWIIN